MAKNKEATVIIFDVGKSASKETKVKGVTFFSQAKECIEKILQRKIFSEPKDEVGLILMGTDQTHNQLNSNIGGYENITEAFDVNVVNWQMLHILEKEIHPNSSEGDWLDSLVAAMDFLKRQTLGGKYSSLKIVLLTTFSTDVNRDMIDTVINALMEMKVELIVITDNVEYRPDPNGKDENDEEAVFSQRIDKSQCQQKSEELIMEILTQTQGVLCDFEQAFVQLIYFEKVRKRAMPWNCKLEIGTEFFINISAYVYMKNVPLLPAWKTEGPHGACKRFTEYFVDDNLLEPDDVSDLITGYMYGSTPIPYDKSLGMSFESEKCFKCIGFTKSSQIHDEHLTGSGVWIVMAQKNSPASEKMLIALIAGLRETNMTMIVRYIYAKNGKVKIMAVSPHQTNDGSYRSVASLAMMEIFFAENHKNIEFPSLKSKKIEPSQEQYDAIDSLIESMNLMNAFDNENGTNEAFPNKNLLDPQMQYTYRALAHRAMYPNRSIPKLEQDLLQLVNVPEKIKEQSIESAKKVKEIFPLENVSKPGKALLYKKLQTISSGPTNDVAEMEQTTSESTVLKVGTVNPAENFAFLLNQGEKFAILCVQLQNVIADLVFKSLMNENEKIEKALMIYREEAKMLGAFRYNEWIVEFKKSLIERNKIQFWENVIVKNGFGLIGAQESETSTVNDDEVKAFYTTSASGDTGNEMVENDNIDDLLGDM